IVRAYEAFDRFDGANFKAWILRIVTNLYINKYRQRQRGPKLTSLEAEGGAHHARENPFGLSLERVAGRGASGEEHPVRESTARFG
ncbi:hypothetical protein EON81_28615, partial [bacterium]